MLGNICWCYRKMFLQRFYIMKEKLKNSGKFEIYFGDGTTSIIEEQNASSISLFISVFLFQFFTCFQKSGLASSIMVHFSKCKFNKKKMFAARNVNVGRGFPLPRWCYVFVLYSKMTWIKAQHWTFIYYMYLFFFCRSEWLFCNYWNSFSKKWPNERNLWT